MKKLCPYTRSSLLCLTILAMATCLNFVQGNPEGGQHGLRKVSICAGETLFVSSQNMALLYTKNKIKGVTQDTSYHAGILSDTILTIARIHKQRSQGKVTVYYRPNGGPAGQMVFTIKFKESYDIFVHREKCGHQPGPCSDPGKAVGILSPGFKNPVPPNWEKNIGCPLAQF